MTKNLQPWKNCDPFWFANNIGDNSVLIASQINDGVIFHCKCSILSIFCKLSHVFTNPITIHEQFNSPFKTSIQIEANFTINALIELIRQIGKNSWQFWTNVTMGAVWRVRPSINWCWNTASFRKFSLETTDCRSKDADILAITFLISSCSEFGLQLAQFGNSQRL